MRTGTKISGIAHVALIGWALFGGTFSSDPLPFDVQDVSVVSAEEYAALTAPRTPPVIADQPTDLPEPEAAAETPAMNSQADPEPEQTAPEPTPEPAAEPAPEPAPEPPAPSSEVADPVPPLETPEPQDSAPTDPPSPRPEPRPVDRVAPQAVAPPPPDVRPDEVATPEVTPDIGAPAQQEPQEQTAPEEAAERIVTEAEQSASLAPTRSPRPPAARPERPKTPAPAETVAEKPAETPTNTRSAVNSALAEALGGNEPSTPAPVPSGPPLTSGEKEALRVAVSSCWNVGSLSSAAMATTVVVAVTMAQDGKPEAASIRMLSSSGGPDAAAKQAFEAARRAIIRCGARGYDLPAEKYGQWRDIEMTFNPERMRIK